jgi:molybdopterin molybdotransferase
MLSIEQARQACAELAAESNSLDDELLTLTELNHRVISEDLFAGVDVPPFNNSAMDGYAICSSHTEKSLFISQRIAAGDRALALEQGTAARIFTGAPVPKGADAVVMQENCEADHDKIEIKKWPKPGENIRCAGEDLRRGDPLLRRGDRVNSAKLASLASCGIHRARVFKRPKVTVFSTGNELVPPGEHLKVDQIFDSNRPMLQAFLSQLEVDVVHSEILDDDRDKTQRALQSAAEKSDIVITAGGVSVGEEDHVKAALEKVGRLDLWKVCMKPGKPLSLGHIGDTLFIGLPGNPVSAYVSMFLFGQQIVRGIAGEKNWQHRSLKIPANFTSNKVRKRPEFMRVQIQDQGLIPYPHQGSGVLSSLVWADALALIPAETPIKHGHLLEVYPL